ncbi:DUF6378 domain-containing protein [Pasteurella multocida]|uniref:DUF6378 domain-containing protein n=1 Tax=Pasteurella multocida TaxID=747 RepID=UPI000C9F6820|nr:DUF6378 domain-containing protein [Pasteurella multocida]VEJ48575.1 Uncharacterised protein [Pasteurella multocida]HDR0920949.1 hypothetical protein [Pasteurella multocida]
MAIEINSVLTERAETHGSFYMNAGMTQSMERILQQGTTYNQWNNEQREAAHMILQKLSRAANGDTTHRDTWLDIVGYATLALGSLNAESDCTV